MVFGFFLLALSPSLFMFLSHRNCIAWVSLNCFVGQRMSKIAFIYQKKKENYQPLTKETRELFGNFVYGSSKSTLGFLFNFSCCCSRLLTLSSSAKATTNQRNCPILYQVWYNESLVLVWKKNPTITTHSTEYKEKNEEKIGATKILWLII